MYVSTVYSNPEKSFIEEKVYESIHKFDLDWYVRCAEVFLPETVISIMHQTHVRL